MSFNQSSEEQSSKTNLSRRDFVRLAASSAIAASSGLASSAAAGTTASGSSTGQGGRPNIILIITDQERYPQYYPPGWANRNLPNRKRLEDHGLTFIRGFCNTAMCSPSRATLFTGLYPQQHGVEHTLTTGGCLSPNEPTLQKSTQNMAQVLFSAGYNVQYRGKWHLTKDVTGTTDASSTDDLEKFGFNGWQPPDAGQDTNPAHFGGGCADYDNRWANQAADFLRSKEALSGQPFALIVSFVNPHDALAFPSTWDQTMGNTQNGYCYNYKDAVPDCFIQGINLSDIPSLNEDLSTNFKPKAQADTLLLLNASLGFLLDGIGPLPINQQSMYVNFYAYLQKIVDQHIGTVLDALEENQSLYNKTIVVRVSDHGEMGLSHQAMRQKLFNAYEETLRVPIVFSNPKLFPNPVRTTAMASLVDIMPTLATLANVPNRSSWDFKGQDLTPIINDAIQNPGNPTVSVQDSILFTYDDDNPGAANPQHFVSEPCHIRCIRDQRYKFTWYFNPCPPDPANPTPPQFELYDLQTDSAEMHNMADPANTAYYNEDLVNLMKAKLLNKMSEVGVTFQPNSPYCPLPTDSCK